MQQKNLEERRRIVELISKSPLAVKAACKAQGISNATYYKWKHELAEAATKQEASTTKAASLAASVTDAANDALQHVLELKRQHPYYGVVKLCKQVWRDYGMQVTPRQVQKLLIKHGLADERPPYEAEPKGSRRFERQGPNDLWQMDIMVYRLRNTGRLYLISALDDYSRFIVAHSVVTTAEAKNVIDVFKAAVETHGLPNQVMTDRGGQFHAWQGMVHFEELLTNLHVEHLLTKPQSPQTNGKIESWHRNIQRELMRQVQFETVEAAQKAITEYVRYYNYERVHMGIGYLVPADRYFGVADEVNRQMVHPHTDPNNFYLVGRLNGQPIRLEQTPDGQVKVYLAGHHYYTWPDLAPLKDSLLPSET
ncbi:MAG: IS3 family transposase [Candidatus Cloacimonadaceae bacterium]|jgi:transposase InsO family protein